MAIVFGFMIDFGSNHSGALHFAELFRKQEWRLSNGVVMDFADCVQVGSGSWDDSSCCYVQPAGMSLPSYTWRLQSDECRVEVLRRFYSHLMGCQGFQFAQAGWEVFGELSVQIILGTEMLHRNPPPGLVVSQELWVQAGRPATLSPFGENAMWAPLITDQDYLKIARMFPGGT